MATYVNILPDGTREEVKYDPKHDGPVSQRLFLLNKVRFFQGKVKAFPGDWRHHKSLARARQFLNEFDLLNPRKRKGPVFLNKRKQKRLRYLQAKFAGNRQKQAYDLSPRSPDYESNRARVSQKWMPTTENGQSTRNRSAVPVPCTRTD